MTLKEMISLLFLAKNLYPRDKSLDKPQSELMDLAKIWAEMLKDIPFDLAKAALTAHAASSPYAPAISEIRSYARKMTEPEGITAEEAWSLAIKAIRRFGSAPYKDAQGKYPYQRARDSLPPEVWRVVDLMGYNSMCMSENADVLRAQFIRAWERQQQRKAERESILPFLPEGLREKVLAISDGQNQ